MNLFTFKKSIHSVLWRMGSWKISAFASNPSLIWFDSLCLDTSEMKRTLADIIAVRRRLGK